MGTFKIVLLSMVGFLLPVGAMLMLAPTVFDGSSENDLKAQAAFGRQRLGEIELGKGDEQLSIEPGSSFASIRSDAALEITPGRPFILSVMVRFAELPKEGERHVFLVKYAEDTKPYPGWGLALHRLSTSLRPELYWKGEDGKGSWFAFDRVAITTDRWYALSAVLNEELQLSLFVQEAPAPLGVTRLVSQAEVLRQVARPNDEELRFLGGYDFSKISLPRTAADLNFGAIRAGTKAFQGELASLLIAAPQSLPAARGKLSSWLRGGPRAQRAKLGDSETKLWISERGIDESSFARPTTLSGGARWEKYPR